MLSINKWVFKPLDILKNSICNQSNCLLENKMPRNYFYFDYELKTNELK